MTVYAYNTDVQGYYNENRDEYPPRLYGWMKTTNQGEFELHTILPGSYPGMRVPAHIHFCLRGAGYPLQWVEELRFQGDPYLTPQMLTQAAQDVEFRTIQPLIDGADGRLSCSYKIKLRLRTNFA